MVKKAGKRAKNPKNGKAKPKQRRAGGKMFSPYSSYLRLLADPCGGAIVHPPYQGMDSGYLIRTRLNFAAPAGTGTGTTNNVMVQWTPAGAAANGLVYRATGDTVYTTLAKADFLTSGVVSKARPVASCLKWIPTGPVTSRQGVVGMSYSTGAMFTAGATTTGAGSLIEALANCNVLASNGSVPHEVKWLPTLADEIYTNPNASVATEVSGGSIFMVLSGVDSTSGVPNGYFEATTVYEWTPANNQGASPSVSLPAAYSVKDALNGIRDVGQFLFGDSSASIGKAMLRVTGNMLGTTMLTGATYMAGRRGGMLQNSI